MLSQRTNFDALVVADIRKSTQCLLCVIAAELGNIGGCVLGLADRLEVRRVRVLVDGTEETARGRSDGELRKRKESSGEDGLGEHVERVGCGVQGYSDEWFDRSRLV
jgi:hypothetical protein